MTWEELIHYQRKLNTERKQLNSKDIIVGDIKGYQSLGENHTELTPSSEEDSEDIQIIVTLVMEPTKTPDMCSQMDLENF